jgi:hypothetical protein
MKKITFSLCFLSVLFLATTAFGPANHVERALAPDFILSEFVSSVDNAELEARFEKQFPEIVAEVSHIDVHQNTHGDYYYTVYGSNEEGSLVVDYFKTTDEEVQTETYDYIQMTATTSWPRRRKCRESFTFPPNGSWCNPYNSGYICGVEISFGGPCIFF